MRLDRDAEARDLLQMVEAWGHGSGQADKARELLEELDDSQRAESALQRDASAP
jgi:hypothetical protein